jgi:hypothetical protein
LTCCAAPAAKNDLQERQDTCATEALEVATYSAIEDVADGVGDQNTAKVGRVDPPRTRNRCWPA